MVKLITIDTLKSAAGWYVDIIAIGAEQLYRVKSW